LVAGVMTLAIIRAWVAVEPSPYSFASNVLYWMRWKTPAQLILSPLLVFGPLIVLPVWFWSGTLHRLRGRLDLLIYLLSFGVLAWIGGSDTERFLVFASPVVWWLIASALDQGRTGRAWFWLAVVTEMLSFRVFLPIIGGPRLIDGVESVWTRLPRSLAWLSNYDSFWSFSLVRQEMVALGAWYGAVALALLAGLWWQQRALVAERR
jgi:hypothetical protein